MINRTEKEIMSTWKEGTKKVAIKCITYNHIGYIAQCLDSMLEQITNFPFTIFVHDDASTDGTTEITKLSRIAYNNRAK